MGPAWTPDELLRFCAARALAAEAHELRTKPRTLHWHLRKEGQTGTLEVTFEHNALILEVRANRSGKWTAEELSFLREWILDSG